VQLIPDSYCYYELLHWAIPISQYRDTTLRTACISHSECHEHDTGEDHPENALRLSAIEDRIIATGLTDVLRYVDAPVEIFQRVLAVILKA
jgi:hypothetical protein